METDPDKIKEQTDKWAKLSDSIVENFRQKNWLALLLIFDSLLLLALFNPLFPLLPYAKQLGWYLWVLIVLGLFCLHAFVVYFRARTKRTPAGPVDLKLSAIKGLLPFGHEDADIFAQLQREQNLKECLQAITDEHWRLGVLSGESGAGKTSFLQAGLWPGLEKREKPKFRCVYVKFSDLDPFESVKRACLKQLQPLALADDKIAEADFVSLLAAATMQDASPIVLLFDQFEQFFVHRKRRSDRAPFVQALTKWFAEMESLPVKLLICIRGDFHDRLNELQKVMKYSLSPTQSFRLERFEPDQATEVFCFLAEKEQLDYDRRFIAEMTRQELADTADGLVSPVDIQVLAWMVAGQTAQDGRAFDRTTFQKLGGVDGLLERYLTRALAVRETEARRQSAIKVLLALTDLERNTRAGALTVETLRQKLGSDITDAELKEAVVWLARSDVRLVSPQSENEEEKYELAHERMIPTLRRLAGKQLGEADRADQLLDRRVNEWLGSGRAARYLFSWPELRLINKHRRFVTWGKERQAKEELLATSWRRFGWRFAAVGLLVLLVAGGWVGWNSNAWQLQLIERELRSYDASVKDNDALAVMAQAFAYTGDSQLALQSAERISDDYFKAAALRGLAEAYAKLGDKEEASELLKQARETAERISRDYFKADALRALAAAYAKLAEASNDRALYSNTFGFVTGFDGDTNRDKVLQSILASKLAIADVGRLRVLTTFFGSEAGRAKALARIVIACSQPELIGKETKDSDDQ